MEQPTTKPLLEARAVGRRHPRSEGWLMRDRSIRIGVNDRVAVVGEVGSGKTLLLRALALLDPLDEGEILWHGEPVPPEGVATFRSQVIYLHQRAPFLPGSAEENLRLPFEFRIHRDKQYNRTRILRYLEQVGRTEDLLDQAVTDLSGGERQIVSLLRAMQLEPTILLLDEPTASLDASATGAVESLVQNWMAEREGRAFVWVSHDAEQVQRVAQRVSRIKI